MMKNVAVKENLNLNRSCDKYKKILQETQCSTHLLNSTTYIAFKTIAKTNHWITNAIRRKQSNTINIYIYRYIGCGNLNWS